MIRILILLLCLFLAPHAHAQPAGCTTTTCTGSALPNGYLTVSGNQIQNNGVNVRLACAEFEGTPNDGSMVALRAAGFNCIRIGWRDVYLGIATTWNPSDISNMTLSGSNLIATSGASGLSDVRTVSSRTSSSVCWELTASTISTDWGTGIANSSFSYANGMGTDTNAIGFYIGATHNQVALFNGAFLTTGANPSVTGDQMTVCANLSTNLAYFTTSKMRTDQGAGAWNNSGTCNPTVAGCGLSFSGMTGPYYIIYNNRETGVAALNTTGPFSVALPSGYTTWDSTPVTTGCASLTQISTCVTNAQAAGLGVVLDHRGNEAVATNSSCWLTQQNGLPYDSGGIAIGSDGCGNTGTVNPATFQYNWVTLASTFSNNPAVIGAELHQNPLVYGASGTRTTTNGNGTGSFSVSGGKLLGPNGSQVNLLGVDLYTDNGFAGGCNSGNSTCPTFQLPTSISDTTNCTPLLSFYPNIAFVRFQVGVSSPTGSFPGALPTAAQLSPYIGCLTKKHIVVALDYHNYGFSLNDSTDSEGQNLNSIEVWQNGIGKAFASNPYFWEMTQNEPAGSTADFNSMIVTLYSAIRNVWMTSTKYYPGDQRNNGSNLYSQTAGSSSASCVSSSSLGGPSGTGSGISDGTCSWNFVGSTVAGNTAPIPITEYAGWQMTGWLNESTVQHMSNVLFDFHAYPWEYGCSPCSSDPGTGTTDAVLTTANNDTSAFTSADTVMPIMILETGNNTICSGSPDPSYVSLFNSDANAPTRISSRFSGVGYFYHNWSSNTCGLTQGNFDADSPVSRTTTGTTVNGFIAAGNGPAPPSSGGPATQIPMTWGGGGSNNSDILQICSTVGAAINAANSGILVFCPGPINGPGGTNLLSGAAKPADCTNISDLSNAGSHAMTGFPVNKMAYAAHFYPQSINGTGCVDSGGTLTADLNAYFGYLEVTGQAPVAILEMGCACDGLVGNATDENAWGAAFTSYLNGMASGGPTFVGTSQPISWNWWAWSNPQSQSAGLNPDGIRNPDNSTLNVGQQDWWSTLLYAARNVTQTTTWNPSDISAGLTLSNSNSTVTSGTFSGATSVRSTTSNSSGNFCWSVTANTITSNWDTGIANGSFVLTSAGGLGGDANGLGFDPNSSGAKQAVFYNNSVISSGSPTSSNGEVVMECANFTSGLYWVTDAAMVSNLGANSWNNSGSCNPTVTACGLSLSGLTCPCFIAFNEYDSGGVATLGTTSGSLPYSLPAGFTAWDQGIVTGTGHPSIQILGDNDNHANDNFVHHVSYALGGDRRPATWR